MEKIAFLPFGYLMDQWMWQVYSGDIKYEDYNTAWWDMRFKYQGLKPPVAREENDFDAGAKYHIPADTPYIRFILMLYDAVSLFHSPFNSLFPRLYFHF